MTEGDPPVSRPEGVIVAGWYQDQHGLVRYWDGARWTEHTWASPSPAETPRPGLRLRFIGAVVEVALAATVVTQIVFINAIWDRLSLLDRAIAHPQTVSFAGLQSADRQVHTADVIVIATYAITGILFVCWFHRARISAERYNPDVLRFGRGWAIGSWITPILGLWRPFQMTTDVLSACELPRGAREWDRREYWLVRVWWLVFVASTLSLWYASSGTDASIDAFKTRSRIAIATGSLRLVAAVLAIAVVVRITAANDRRCTDDAVIDTSAAQIEVYSPRTSKSRKRARSRAWPPR